MTDQPTHRPTHRLTWHRYGKAEVRVVHVDRSTPRHRLRDLNVSTALRGPWEAAYTAGDNSRVLPTDSQKNAVFGLAREHGVGEVEDFALVVARSLLDSSPPATAAEVSAEEHPWSRIPVPAPGEGAGGGAGRDGATAGHDHAFTRAGGEVRTTSLALPREGTAVLHGGLRDLVVLKTTGSEFSGFPRDRFTSLGETDERILATSVTATWRYADGWLDAGLDFGDLFATARTAMLATFAQLHSLALQQTLHAMASAVLDAVPAIAEVTFAMPNKHHFLYDLAPYGLDNPDAVYHADDRPYGLIEGTVARGAP